MTFGFIHVARMGSWRSVLHDQIRAIEASGIRQGTAAIYAYVVGPAEAYPYPDWLRVIDLGPDLKRGENPTMERVWAFAKLNPGAKVWYIHTKGASFNPPNPYSVAWRKWMEAAVLHRWRECSLALETHDVAGVEWWQARTPAEVAEHERVWRVPPAGIWGAFAGNFWWSTTDYLGSLPPDRVDLVTDRWGSEWSFIGCGEPRVASLGHSGRNLYLEFPEV